MSVLIVSCVLAAVLGFAAHRASVCTVRAVAEVLTSGRAHCLVSFGKSALWVLVILLPVMWYDRDAISGIQGFSLSLISISGGLMFGIGAAMNGGCAFSTLARLADGQMRMIATLGGFPLGVAMSLAPIERAMTGSASPAKPALAMLVDTAGLLSIVVGGWALFEVTRLWRSRAEGVVGWRLPLVGQYRLSTAALLMGLANGILFLLNGQWAYTGAIRQGVEGLLQLGEMPTMSRGYLLLSVVLGMLVSTWARGSFKFDFRVGRDWLLNFAGGALMGAGTAMVPGGNDALILFAIPSLSPHAVPSYLGMLFGIAVVMLLMRRITGGMMYITCDCDICRPASGRD